MSQSIIQKNNRSRYHEDDDRSTNNARKYHPSQQAQIPDDAYRSNSSWDNSDDQENPKRLYNKYPVIIGDFTLAKPSDENSIYNYKPKRTQTSYVYQGIATPAEVQARAMNEIRQYREPPNIYQKRTPFLDNRTHYQSMLTLPSSNYRSASNDDLTVNHPRNSIYGNLHRRNHSFSSFYSSYLPRIQIDPKDRYYFGEPSDSSSSDIELESESSSEDETCAIFGQDSKPKSMVNYPTFNDQDEYPEIIFQEVVDVGTSTDDLLSNSVPIYRPDARLAQQKSSLVTNQSARHETEIYRISHQILARDNDEEPATVPFPTVKHPQSLPSSSSSSSTMLFDKSPLRSNNYDVYSLSVDPPIRNQTDEDLDEEDDESQRSPTPERPAKLHHFPQRNPVIDLPRSRPENVPIARPPEPYLSYKSVQSDKSRGSFFNLFNRRKKKDDQSTSKKKSKSSKKDKNKRKP